jgi:hypothetical protein
MKALALATASEVLHELRRAGEGESAAETAGPDCVVVHIVPTEIPAHLERGHGSSASPSKGATIEEGSPSSCGLSTLDEKCFSVAH